MFNEEITQKTHQKRRKLLLLPLAAVVPSRTNPRKAMDPEALAELKATIAQGGLIQPITVREAGDLYEIVAGHRRHAAFTELAHEHPGDPRFTHIEAIRGDIADQDMPSCQLIENLFRADLKPLEVADGVARAIAAGTTKEELAAKLGWCDRKMYRTLELHAAPDWLKR